MKSFMSVHINWYCRGDLREISRIENASFDHPWTMDEIREALADGATRAFVASINDEVVGYAIFSSHRKHIVLKSIAVHPEFRRMGIGSQLLGKVADKLTPSRRTSLECLVRESNLRAHLFLSACGMRATEIKRDEFINGEDAYLFRLSVEPATGDDVLRNIVEGDGKVLA